MPIDEWKATVGNLSGPTHPNDRLKPCTDRHLSVSVVPATVSASSACVPVRLEPASSEMKILAEDEAKSD